jgi:hypothetical protein
METTFSLSDEQFRVSRCARPFGLSVARYVGSGYLEFRHDDMPNASSVTIRITYFRDVFRLLK